MNSKTFIPQRTCCVCRNKTEKDNLIRIAKVNGNIIVDNTHNKNGRGIYVCKTENCVNKLIKINAINRNLKANLTQEKLNNIIDIIKSNIQI